MKRRTLQLKAAVRFPSIRLGNDFAVFGLKGRWPVTMRLKLDALIILMCMTLLMGLPLKAAAMTSASPAAEGFGAPASGVIITPGAAAFGDVKVGTKSPTLSFTATNNTSSTVGYISLSGSSSFNLQPGTCHLVSGEVMLAVGASCTFTASFSPAALGSATATMNIGTSSGPFTFQLSGYGVPAVAVLISPSSAIFGNVAVGTVSPTLAFTAVNDTDSTIGYVSTVGSPEFRLSPGTCHLANNEVMLAEDSSCVFYAAFAPTTPGAATATLNISTSSGPFTFQLTGTGVSALPVSKPGGPYTGLTGKPIAFSGIASTAPTGQTITGYAWNFGDGTSGTGPTPTHTYSAQGTFNVTLTVTDTQGQTAVVATTAVIAPAPNPLTITAQVSPAPNGAGWNNTPVTVSFICSSTGSPVVECPASQTFSTDVSGQVVSGTVHDVAGDIKTASITINLEVTPPTLSITSPTANSTLTLSTSSIGVSGNVSSPAASIVSVTCSGKPATLSNAAFNCTAPLIAGSNPLPVIATDIAGNKTTVSLNLTYVVAPALQIVSPANLGITNLTPVTVNGTVNDPHATITIDGVTVPQSGGAFSTPVPLVEGLNILTAVATNAAGISTTATVEVTLDTTPPHVLISSPPSGTVLTAPSVTVTGLANDVVVGTVNLSDLRVVVNGVAAQVANRNFSALNVPLALGTNTIQAIGTDRAGNSTTTSVTVTRVLASQPPAPAIGKAVLTNWVNIVSGNNQTGTVGTPLSAPIVVSLTDSASRPLANQMVVFKVTANNGVVNVAGGVPSSALALTTDANGRAQVIWTLGQRAGAGNNTLTVSAALAVSPVTFTANGSNGKPTQIVVDSGNNQTGVLGQPLPFPFVVDVIDAGHNRVPGIPVVFSIKQGGGSFAGAPTLTVTSDSNGRAIAILTDGLQQGINNNVVEATFAGNPGMPASFAATAKVPGNPSATTISGVVLDNSNNPIKAVTIRLYKTNQGSGNNLPVQVGTPVETDAQGTFVIAPAPVGAFKLMADGSTAAGTLTFPTLEYDIVTVAGNDNTVGMPIYLPNLDTVNKVCVDETHGGVLTLPQYPGFALNIPAGSATFPGGARSGCVSATPVNGDKVPMSPGFGQQPRFIVTIQPVGTIFSPPASMTLPNVDGLKPKSVIEMYSYDHDLAMFVAIGTGTVSSDGSTITSDPGVGVIKAGWHCGGDPNTTGSAGTCPLCNTCQGDQCVADSRQNGMTKPDDKCMACQNGSLVQLPLDDTKLTLSAKIELPPPTIQAFDNFINKFKSVGLTGSLSTPSIEYEYTTEPCCSKKTGVIGNKTSGEVSGDLGGFTLRGQIYPPAAEIPPPFDIPINLGFFKAIAKGEVTGGISATLAAEITGKVGHQANPCSDDPTLQTGCFYAEAGATVTPEVTADLNLKVTYDCENCFISNVEASFKVTGVDLKWPINIEGIKYNGEDDCKSGLSYGTISAPEGTLTSGLAADVKATVDGTEYSFSYDISLECTVTLDALPECSVK